MNNTTTPGSPVTSEISQSLTVPNSIDSDLDVEADERWQAQVKGEAAIAQALRNLDAAYDHYRSTLRPEQQKIFDSFFELERERYRGIRHYLAVVAKYRERRSRDRNYRDDHPYTQFL
ncbi:hypothetical protein INT45_013873 [Circinella minor]|uniref:Uncharacterized protein n=1 Tax=Circinella minor TaxID=1195481 RepID=A0A8H7VH04_9FUNG|nr:hypothetical protein INT45_013873 [Circinella minor]